jgi:hypothetical protein
MHILKQHFGTLDQLFRRTDEVSTLRIRGAKGLQAKLEAPGALETALLCRRLATLRDDVSDDVTAYVHTSPALLLSKCLCAELAIGSAYKLVAPDLSCSN